MPTEMTEHRSESSSMDAPATGKAGAAVDRDAKLPQTDLASKPVPPGGQRSTWQRRLLMGVLGVLVLAAALWFGIPYILLTLSTVSTDDAFVNGHVTFIAPRVHGQVSRVLVDDNNRVHKGDLLVELDKEPFQDAVAVKKAAVDTAQADLQAARATVRGIEAQAMSRRWNLQHAMEDVANCFTNPSSGLAFYHVTAGAGTERPLRVERRTVHRKNNDFDMGHPLLDLSN